MSELNITAVDPTLHEGARNAIETCLGVKSGERVALIFDEPSREVAASLGNALESCGARWGSYCVEDYSARPLAGAPKEVLAGLEVADAGILCFQPLIGELAARKEIVGVVERRRIRYAHMVSVTPQIMREGMRSDYLKIDELSKRLCQRMQSAITLKVSTKGGTSIRATFNPDLDWVKTSGLISPRYWSNLPAGEVFTTPASVDGTFVCDGTAGDHFNAKYGDLRDTPLVLELEAGRLKSVHCDRRDLREEFWNYCHTDENSDRVGELAFGTNLGLTDMIGVLLQDEKLPGVHLAFGDPYGSQTHASWQSKTHVDVLTRRCDVWIDEDQVIKKGRYDLEMFGLSSTNGSRHGSNNGSH